MFVLAKRFAGPLAVFFGGIALQISGYENFNLAISIWVLAGVWSIFAIITWEPIKRFLTNFPQNISRALLATKSVLKLRLSIYIKQEQTADQKYVDDAEPKGWLDHRLSMEQNFASFTDNTIRFSFDTRILGNRIQKQTKKIIKHKTTDKLYESTREVAKEIQKHINTTKNYITDVKLFNQTVKESFLSSKYVSLNDSKVIKASINKFVETLRTTETSLHSFIKSISSVLGITQELNISTKECISVTESLITEMQTTEQILNDIQKQLN